MKQVDLNEKPFLFLPALHYVAGYMATIMGFSELYQFLGKFIFDENKRWSECVRVKRGICDTSEPGGMYKDQIYFQGAVKILKKRKTLDFVALHCGKLNLEDCQRLNRSK